tara:strand:- start:272 stop:1234 length:963 start_codon:yes stop_codon:yes gene_type:complete
MSYNQDLENAVRRIFVEAFPTGVENEDAPPNELDVDKIKGNPLVEVYEPTDSISDEQWKKIRHSYMLTFTFMQNINENVVNKYLDYLWDNWNRGGYKCSEDFINKVDELFENLRQVVAKRNKMSFLDDALYDELFEGYQNVINQMTWDDSITDKLLKDKAIEHQADIKVYLKKRVDHNIKLTDKMKAFEGVADLTKKKLAPEPEPPKSKLHPDNIAKTKDKYSVRRKRDGDITDVPIHYQEDYDANWKCAMEMRRLHCIGKFGKFDDVEIFSCFDWAVENCTVKGEPIEHRNKLINGYSNAKRKTKSAIIIAKFEEDYYK